MEFSFEQALVDVWRQVLVENAKVVELAELDQLQAIFGVFAIIS